MNKARLYPSNAIIPQLASLEPRRRGRGGSESLSSYIAGLAMHHRCSPYVLLHRGVIPEELQAQSRWSRVRGGEGHLINAYGSVAEDVSNEVFEATGQSVSSLTALGFRRFCDPVGKHFMHTVRPWCAMCYMEARQSDLPAWDPLYVFAKSSMICVWHEVRLRFFCRVCKKGQRPIPHIPFLDICEYCGADLATQVADDKLTKAERDYALWCARAFMDTLDSISRCENLSHENFVRNVTIIRDAHFSGLTRRMSTRLGLAKSSAKNWIERQSRPTWMSLVDLAYRLDMSPVQLTGSSLSLTDPAYWRVGSPISLDKKHTRRSEADRENMRRSLRDIIEGKSDSSPPDLTLRDVARQLGTTVDYLCRTFAEESKEIVERRRTALREFARIRDSERQDRISAARRALALRGLSPTTRNLRATGQLSVTDLVEASK